MLLTSCLDMHQFLKRNATILTYTFEVNEEDYDESVLPTNVVVSACRRSKYEEKRKVAVREEERRQE